MDNIYIKIRYKDYEVEFKGSIDEVYREITKWFINFLPSLDVAEKLLYDVDYTSLTNMLSNYIYITRKGEIVMKKTADDLSLHNKILLILSATRLLEFLGKRERSSIQLDELSRILTSTPKTVSSRLSELRSMGYIERIKENKSVEYRITLKGLLYIQNKLSSS